VIRELIEEIEIEKLAEEYLQKEALIGPMMELSGLGLPSAAGYAIGRTDRPMGREGAKKRLEEGYSIGKGLLIPGYTGYRAGKRSAAREYLEAEKEKKSSALLGQIEVEKLAEACIDQLALELANEWLEKNAVFGSRGAMAKAISGIVREGGAAAKSGTPNPDLFKQTAKSLARRVRRQGSTAQARGSLKPVTATYGG